MRASRLWRLAALAGCLALPVPSRAITPTSVRFTAVSSVSVSLSWALDTPASEAPVVALSTEPDFARTVFEATGPIGLQATSYMVTYDNTTFYFRVKVSTENDANFSAAVSTVNASRGPTGMVFDDISTSAITASAYAPTQAFNNLADAPSSVNVARGGAYAGWRTGAQWAAMTVMPTARERLAAAAARGRIYALGGNGGPYLGTNEEYDPGADAWAAKSAMPTPRWLFVAAEVGGRIYAIGGSNGANLAVNEEYDPETDTWKVKASMPTARSGAAAAVVGGKIYVIGGLGGSQNENEVYDPATDTWQTKTAMPTARQGHGAAAVGGRIYVMGGLSGARLSVNEEYDPAADSWTTKAAMPTARMRLATAALGGKVLVMGGNDPNELGNNEEYDPAVDRWAVRPDMPTAREGLAAVVLDGRIHAVGGSDGGSEVAANEQYDPRYAAPFGGLAPNTQYSFKAKVRNQLNQETAESAVVSTYTLAAVGRPVGVSTITSLTSTGFTVTWASGVPGGQYNPAGTDYDLELSTSPVFATPAASAQTQSTFTAVTGLDTTAHVYHGRVRGVNAVGQPGHWLGLGPSSIPPGPAVDVATFTEVWTSSLTMNWSSGTAAAGYNASGIEYVAEISTDTAFLTLNQSSRTLALNAAFYSLLPNVTYSMRVKALESDGDSSAYHVLGATATLPAPPAAAAPTAVSTFSATANWLDNGNSTSTVYEVWLATDSNFAAINTSSLTYDTSAVFSSLEANTTYYFEVRARGSSGNLSVFTVLPSTMTLLNAPGAAAAAFTTVERGSITVNWTDGGNQAGSFYTVQVSTLAGFDPIFTTSDTANLFVLFGAGGAGAELGPNATHYFQARSTRPGETSAFVGLGSTVTLAAPPTGAALTQVWATSVTVGWNLSGNPASTLAELDRSTDNVAFTSVTASALTQYTDGSLAGCSTYYYRVRNISRSGIPTAYDETGKFITAQSTPSAPGAFSAASVAGRKIGLSWTPSPSEGVIEYRLYFDNGTEAVDYASVYAVFTDTETSYTTPVLVSSPSYVFGLRTVNRCGIEGSSVAAAAASTGTFSSVRAVVTVPAGGVRVAGNSLTVLAELFAGTASQTGGVLFQYKASSDPFTSWTDMAPAGAGETNPDNDEPYFIHWDVTGLPSTDYDIRAVASGVSSGSDTAPGSVSVVVDPAVFDLSENIAGGNITKTQAVYNTVANAVRVVESANQLSTKIDVPAGSLNTSTAVLTLVTNPTLPAPAPAGATNIGLASRITLSNGQEQLAGGQSAALTYTYKDGDADGVVDGTSVRAEILKVHSFNAASGGWAQDALSDVDEQNRTVTGRTTHFSFFSAFGVAAADMSRVRAYPVPYRPNSGRNNDGKPVSAGDRASGIVFDRLPAEVTIHIYPRSGQLVERFQKNDGTDTAQWDARNSEGRDVASGGYLAVIKDKDGHTVVKKLVIIR